MRQQSTRYGLWILAGFALGVLYALDPLFLWVSGSYVGMCLGR
jgi:hypothetical protein